MSEAETPRVLHVSFRFATTDGVSLETVNDVAALDANGYRQHTFCGGELDTSVYSGVEIPEMHLLDPQAVSLTERFFSGEPDEHILTDIETRAQLLVSKMRPVFDELRPDLLVTQNILSLPMNIPLTVALGRLMVEYGTPTIDHTHDIYWERERYDQPFSKEFLEKTFFPDNGNVRHMTINSIAQAEVKRRRGLDSVIAPNVRDFNHPYELKQDRSEKFRRDIKVDPEDVLILQPTRIVPRKKIDLTVELVAGLRQRGVPAVLIFAHRSGDEGDEYLAGIIADAKRMGVPLRQIDDLVLENSPTNGHYSLAEVYQYSDFVSYPSEIEGFGNALLETIYYRRPGLINRYPVYRSDIGPKGFDFIEINGAMTPVAIDQVVKTLTDPLRQKRMTDHNYETARHNYSQEVLNTIFSQVLHSL